MGFKDYTLLRNFRLNFDNNIKITPQSIYNIKNRKLVYKPVRLTSGVIRFYKYINLEFPYFKLEWLFYLPPSNKELSLVRYQNKNLSLIKFNDKVNEVKSNIWYDVSINIAIALILLVCFTISILLSEGDTMDLNSDNEINYVESESKNITNNTEIKSKSIWVDTNDYDKHLEFVKEEKRINKEMLDKRKVNNEDIFDSDDIGESLRRLFKVSNDNTDNSNENDLKSNKSYRPLIPDSYGELIREYRENSEKLKKFTENLDNRVLTNTETKEYKDLTEQQTYLKEQRIHNYKSKADVYDREIIETEALKAKLLDLQESLEKDSDKRVISHDITKALETNKEKIDKLFSDKITLRKKFEGESYIGESEKVRDTDWSKNLVRKEIRHIESMTLDTKEAVKERIAIEDRKKTNEEGFDSNKVYSEADIQKSKEVLNELKDDFAAKSASREEKEMLKAEAKLEQEIKDLEESLSKDKQSPNNSDKYETREDDLD